MVCARERRHAGQPTTVAQASNWPVDILYDRVDDADIRNAAGRTEQRAMTKQERTAEARRIARANEGRIIYLSDDAEYFEVGHTLHGIDRGVERDARVVTHFEWNEFRFEGF
jgi:hypothetical protein